MQPYFLPYLGYFQMMSAVDKFVLLDDVNFINRGWINRNRIAVGGKPHWFTIPLLNASQNRLINDIMMVDDGGTWKRKMLRMFELSYSRSAFAVETLGFARQILDTTEARLSVFLAGHLRRMADHLGLRPNITVASEAHPRQGLVGSERILDICRRERATTYVNLPGGRNLYHSADFAAAGIGLRFLEPSWGELDLQHGAAEPDLSIVDLLMLNPREAVGQAITMFSLTET
jgi:hypothetical protein